MEYTLPDGTFAPGTYDVHADPQALAHPAELTVKVRPAPGSTLARTPGGPSPARDMLSGRGTLTIRCT